MFKLLPTSLGWAWLFLLQLGKLWTYHNKHLITSHLINSFVCFPYLTISSLKQGFVVQSLSHVWLSAAPWTAACQASLSFTISQSLLKFMSIELAMLSNHLILCRPLLLLPSIFPSISAFSNESALCIRWRKYWSFSFSPSNEYSALISFRIDWCDLLVVEGTRESSPAPQL